jgi:cation transport ATPase
VPADIAANIDNNVWALLVGGLLGLAATFLIARRSGDSLRPGQAVGGGLLISSLVFGAGAAWFFASPDSFGCGAHFTAAIVMFVFIIAVVAWNAWGAAGQDLARAGRTAYGVLAPTMILSAAVLGVLAWQGLPNGVFWIEAALITQFAVFWVIQSRELWHEGVRAQPAERSA